MDNRVKVLENLLYGDKDGFEIVLRKGQGIDKNKFAEICNILVEMKNEWDESTCVPKGFMQIFLEFRESCENSLMFYGDDEQIDILQHIDKILDLVNEIICE